MDTKTCKWCGETKPTDKFYKNQGRRCKSCDITLGTARRRINRIKKYGAPLTVAERFWKYTERREEHECWEWKGATIRAMKRGVLSIRPVLSVNGKIQYAYRTSWEIHRGNIPERMFVCHHCDNPTCVNPKHLFLGLPRDNTRDSINKGRMYYQRFTPSPIKRAKGFRKLSDRDVLDIRALRAQGKSLSQVARIFDVTNSTVSTITNRKSRADVQ